jgi:hypothetical protein
MLILPLKKCKYAEVPQMVDTLGVVCSNTQGNSTLCCVCQINNASVHITQHNALHLHCNLFNDAS